MASERIFRDMKWSPEDRARYRAIREWFQTLRPSLGQMQGTEPFDPPISLDAYLVVRPLTLQLVAARESAGLSLADVAERSGIDKAALSRLENGVHDNPTIETLKRYAAAVGKKLTWKLEDLAPV
jgi:DNA-binding XRE family transcriptional regulator